MMGMSTTAEKSADGSYYTVNGSKMWITNGTVDGETTGDNFIVYVKTGQGRTPSDLSAFIIEKGKGQSSFQDAVIFSICLHGILFQSAEIVQWFINRREAHGQ